MIACAPYGWLTYVALGSGHTQEDLVTNHSCMHWKLSFNLRLITSSDLLCMRIRRRSDYIIGLIAPAIGPNKSKKLTPLIALTHNIRGKVCMKNNIHRFADDNCLSEKPCMLFFIQTLPCTGADPRMVRIGTGPPFWQINHANSAYFRLFLGYFRVISATRPPPFGSRPPLFTYPGSVPGVYCVPAL